MLRQFRRAFCQDQKKPGLQLFQQKKPQAQQTQTQPSANEAKEQTKLSGSLVQQVSNQKKSHVEKPLTSNEDSSKIQNQQPSIFPITFDEFRSKFQQTENNVGNIFKTHNISNINQIKHLQKIFNERLSKTQFEYLLDLHGQERKNPNRPGKMFNNDAINLLSGIVSLLEQDNGAEMRELPHWLTQRGYNAEQVSQIVKDEEKAMRFMFLQLGLKYNQFGELTPIVKQLFYTAPSTKRHRYDWLLNQSVTIPKQDSILEQEKQYFKYIPHTLVSDPKFVYSSAAGKRILIKEYHREQEKMKSLARIVSKNGVDRPQMKDLEQFKNERYVDLYNKVRHALGDQAEAATEVVSMHELYTDLPLETIKKFDDLQFVKDIKFSNETLREVNHFEFLSGISQSRLNRRITFPKRGFCTTIQKPEESEEQKQVYQNEETKILTETEAELAQEEPPKDDFVPVKFSIFEQFSVDNEQHSQKLLEEYINGLDVQERNKLLKTIVRYSYEINQIIPNIEFTLYKLFTSPLTTLDTPSTVKDPLLSTNLFTHALDDEVYKSLLQSVYVTGKKKHLKKIIQHYIQYANKEYNEDILYKFIEVTIQHGFPFYLGQIMKKLIQEGYPMSQDLFLEFTLYLNKCKGIQQDARRFLFMTSDTEVLQIKYELLRPFFLRDIRQNKSSDILKFFEQCRKNFKLNKSHHENPEDTLNKLRKEFYRGLITDLIDYNMIPSAEVVYGELLTTERDRIDIHDHLLGLQIFAAKEDIERYSQILNIIIEDESQVDHEEYVRISSHFQKFQREELQPKVKIILTSYTDFLRNRRILINDDIFKNIAKICINKQNWDGLIYFLDICQKETSKPSYSSMAFIKEQVLLVNLDRNLIYCFEGTQRNGVKDNIERIQKLNIVE